MSKLLSEQELINNMCEVIKTTKPDFDKNKEPMLLSMFFYVTHRADLISDYELKVKSYKSIKALFPSTTDELYKAAVQNAANGHFAHIDTSKKCLCQIV